MKHKAVTQRILAWMLALALLFTGILPAKYSKPDRKMQRVRQKAAMKSTTAGRISDQNSGR